MSGIESPAPPPASSNFDLKKFPLQCLVLLTLQNLTGSQPKTEQLWACFALVKQYSGHKVSCHGGQLQKQFQPNSHGKSRRRLITVTAFL